MICVDDLNGWIRPLGGYHQNIHTPALDRLASQGVVFTKAYCSVPACNPSRTALLTGLAPTVSGCYLNQDKWLDIVPDAVTLPRLFKQSGYWTAGFGKIFHNESNDDSSAWHVRTYRQISPYPTNPPLSGIHELWETRGRFDWGPIDVSVEEMDDHHQVNHAIDALQTDRDPPFFIACGIFRPHLPWYVPRKFIDLYPLDEINLPIVLETDLEDIPTMGRRHALTSEHELILEAGQWKNAVQAYIASISFADYEIGRLLDALETSGKSNNTMIVLWSDHGWHLGPKNHWRKFSLWEEATRSVLMFSGPDFQKGRTCERTVSLLDVFPTLSDYLGIQLPTAAIKGNSLLPLLNSPDLSWPYPAISTFIRGNHSIRSEEYRYTRYSDGGEELYDHRVDPNEWTNLAGQDKARDIIDELSKWLPTQEAPTDSTYPHLETAWLEAPSGRRFLNPNVEEFLG
ncbi:MAG: sulfatase [Cyanobacteria bacterium P01_E01_bin.45]